MDRQLIRKLGNLLFSFEPVWRLIWKCYGIHKEKHCNWICIAIHEFSYARNAYPYSQTVYMWWLTSYIEYQDNTFLVDYQNLFRYFEDTTITVIKKNLYYYRNSFRLDIYILHSYSWLLWLTHSNSYPINICIIQC